MLKALDQLKDHTRSTLAQVLLQQKMPSIPKDVPDLQFFDDTLNDSQKDAVRFALASPEIALIHGPPGRLIKSYIASW